MPSAQKANAEGQHLGVQEPGAQDAPDARSTKKSVSRPAGKANLVDAWDGRFLSIKSRFANARRMFGLLCEWSAPEHDRQGKPTGFHEVTCSDRKLADCIGVSKKTIARCRSRLAKLLGEERFGCSALRRSELPDERDVRGRFLQSNLARRRQKHDVHSYRFELRKNDDELEEARRKKQGGSKSMMAVFDESLFGWKPAQREAAGWYLAHRNAEAMSWPSIDGCAPGQRGKGRLAERSQLSRATLYRARAAVESYGLLERRTVLDERGRKRRRFKVLVTPERETDRFPEHFRRRFRTGQDEISIGTRRDRHRDTTMHEVGSAKPSSQETASPCNQDRPIASPLGDRVERPQAAAGPTSAAPTRTATPRGVRELSPVMQVLHAWWKLRAASSDFDAFAADWKRQRLVRLALRMTLERAGGSKGGQVSADLLVRALERHGLDAHWKKFPVDFVLSSALHIGELLDDERWNRKKRASEAAPDARRTEEQKHAAVPAPQPSPAAANDSAPAPCPRNADALLEAQKNAHRKLTPAEIRKLIGCKPAF